MASSLVWSCHAPVIRARRWIMAITIFFSLFFPLHCLADHLLLQLTCERSWWPRWLTPGEPESGKSCERWRETERESKRPRPTCTTRAWNHTPTHTALCLHTALSWRSPADLGLKRLQPRRDATFMQHEAVISFGFRSSWRDSGMMRPALTGAAIPTAQLGHQPDKSCLLEPQKTQDRAASVIPTWHWPQHQSLELI